MSETEVGGAATGVETRAGYVTLAGRPNAGKSTLLNALVGSRLSIVTPRAQTTWQRVTGLHTEDGVQMIFLDTPGLLDVRDLLQRSMLSEALTAVQEADVLLLVLDATLELDERTARILRGTLSERNAPLFGAVNKIDEAQTAHVESLSRWVREELGGAPYPVSALRGEGVGELRAALRRALPVSPFLYPPDDIASQPVRFFVAEMVRETVFEQYRQEIPYSTFCRVEEFREHEEPIYVGVTIFVERESQKGIIVGKGGKAIRELGKVARSKIEHFLERRVYLDLWVKALTGWRRKRSHLSRLGFHVPEDDDDASR
ncbi:MAG: GTPase Era [Gemmatimonadota bacterium]|jgi:GTP-binding protein Era